MGWSTWLATSIALAAAVFAMRQAHAADEQVKAANQQAEPAGQQVELATKAYELTERQFELARRELAEIRSEREAGHVANAAAARDLYSRALVELALAAISTCNAISNLRNARVRQDRGATELEISHFEQARSEAAITFMRVNQEVALSSARMRAEERSTRFEAHRIELVRAIAYASPYGDVRPAKRVANDLYREITEHAGR